MANLFDQFDEQPNIFDQFDEPAPDLIPPNGTERSIPDRIARGFGLAGRDILEGAAGVAGIVTNPISFGVNKLSNLVGGPDLATEDLRGNVSQNLTALGLPTPENRLERAASNINQAVVGGGGFIGTGRAIAANAPGIARTIGQTLAAQPALQGASAVTSAGAIEALPEDTSPAIKLGVGLAGAALPFVPSVVSAVRATPKAAPKQNIPEVNVSVQDGVSVGRPSLDAPVDITPKIDLSTQPSAETIVSGLRRGKPSQVAEAVLPDAKIIESAQRLGVDLNPEHYSTNVAFQGVARALKSQGGSKLQASEVKALDDLATRSDKLVADLGGSTDKAGVSESIRAELSDTIESLAAESRIAYKAVNEAVPPKTLVNTGPLRAFVDEKIALLGGNKKLLSGPEKALLTLLGSKKAPNRPTYAALDRVRKEVGRGFQRRGLFAEADDVVLSEVYGALSDIQRGVANSFGVGDIYNSGRALVAKRKGLEDTAVQLFGRNLSQSLVPKIQTAATKISKGDTEGFVKLLASVPEGRRSEVAATVLGAVLEGGSRKGGRLGQGFVSTFAELNKQPTAKRLLLENLSPVQRKRFNDIGRVLTGIIKSNAKPLANPSGSAAGIIKSIEDGSMLGKIYDVGRKVVAAEGISSSVGVPGMGTASVIGAVIGKGKTSAVELADNLLTSPAFKEAMNRSIQGNAAAAERIAARSPVFTKWKAGQSAETVEKISRIGFFSWLIEENTNGL